MVKVFCGSLLIDGLLISSYCNFSIQNPETYFLYCFIYPCTMISNRAYSTFNWLHGSSSIVASLPRRSRKRKHKTKNVGSTKKKISPENHPRRRKSLWRLTCVFVTKLEASSHLPAKTGIV
jgi:hypothetical protein